MGIRDFNPGAEYGDEDPEDSRSPSYESWMLDPGYYEDGDVGEDVPLPEDFETIDDGPPRTSRQELTSFEVWRSPRRLTIGDGVPAEEYGTDEEESSHDGDVSDPEQSAGSLPTDRPPVNLDAAHEWARDDTRREIPQFTDVPIRDVIEGLGKAATALRDVLDFWDAGAAELTVARATGQADGISDQDVRRVNGMRPQVEQALAQTVSMQELAASGTEPAPDATAALAVQLTDFSETAELVRRNSRTVRSGRA